MKRFIILFEFICIFSSVGLAIYWYKNPSENVEPIVVLLMTIPIALEVVLRLKKKKKLIKSTPEKNQYGNGSNKILVIDDDEYYLKHILSIFSIEGIDAIGASSASEAINLYRDKKNVIDVVICDVMMKKPKSPLLSEYLKNGVETGVALSQWIKNENPDISIIGFSGIDHEDINGSWSGSWFSKNANGFLSKPLSAHNMVEIFELISGVRK